MRAGRAIATLSVLPVLAGCRKPAEAPPVVDAVPPAPAFVAAPFRTLDVPELDLRLEAPANLVSRLEGDTLRLTAEGFPGASVRVTRTESAAAVGGGGRCDERSCRYEYSAPCRRLTCEVSEPGEHVSFIPALCGSLRSTYQPQQAPAVRPLSTGGSYANCDDRQVELAQTLDRPIADLLPRIEACWRDHAGDDPAWTAGEVDVRLERTVGEGMERSYRLLAVLSGLEGDTATLQGCLDAAVQPLRSRLPAIVDADCTFAWDHRFLLGRETVCPASGEEAAAAPDGGGTGPGADERGGEGVEAAAPDDAEPEGGMS